MNSLPDAIILVGISSEMKVVKECLKLSVPLVAILDTNCDPSLVDFFVPANDDSVSSVTLIVNEFARCLSV
jgi:small subunit ribosomal protein S2